MRWSFDFLPPTRPASTTPLRQRGSGRLRVRAHGRRSALTHLRLGYAKGPANPPSQLIDVLVQSLGSLENVGQVVYSRHGLCDGLWWRDKSYVRAWRAAVELRQESGREGAPKLRWVFCLGACLCVCVCPCWCGGGRTRSFTCLPRPPKHDTRQGDQHPQRRPGLQHGRHGRRLYHADPPRAP